MNYIYEAYIHIYIHTKSLLTSYQVVPLITSNQSNTINATNGTLKEGLRNLYKECFNKYILMDIEQREFNTKAISPPHPT